jgi:hypothetical protein
MMGRLLRESNPPTGQLPSPKPQYKDVQTNSWEELKGEGGASYVKDKDVLAKLEKARALLDAISGKDFATQTTLKAALTELVNVKSELETIKANQLSDDQKVTLKDASGAVVSPATEATLEQVRVLLNSINSKDFATDAKLEQARVLLNSINSKDFATQAELVAVKQELQAIKNSLTDGTQKVTLSGAKVVESAPVTGIKTVTSTVAEVFAGSSRKANRSKLVIRNLHQAVAIRIGGSNITDTIGQSLEPGASVEIDFSPSTAVSIYAVSTAGNVSVEVLEV